MVVATLIVPMGCLMFKKVDKFFFDGQGNWQDRLYFYGSMLVVGAIVILTILAI